MKVIKEDKRNANELKLGELVHEYVNAYNYSETLRGHLMLGDVESRRRYREMVAKLDVLRTELDRREELYGRFQR